MRLKEKAVIKKFSKGVFKHRKEYHDFEKIHEDEAVKLLQKISMTKIQLNVTVLSWNDAMVDGIEDTNGDLIPSKSWGGDRWIPIIDIDSGVIVNWNKGTTAEVHYKIKENGEYILKDRSENHMAQCKTINTHILDARRKRNNPQQKRERTN